MAEEKSSLDKALEAIHDAVAHLDGPIISPSELALHDAGAPAAGPSPADLDAAPSADIGELEKASQSLKGRIEDAKKRNDMPIDAQLGSPDFERRAADGSLDRPDDDDE